MSIFYIDQREFRREVHALIDSNPTSEYLRSEIGSLVDSHGVQIDKEVLAGYVIKMCMAQNPHRAKKIVDAIGDKDLRNVWRFSVIALIHLVRLSVLIGIVWAVIALYHWVGAP